jgi:diguanylate cyclase (GGDEF)-like protein
MIAAVASWIAVAAGVAAVILALAVLLLLRRKSELEGVLSRSGRDEPELAGSLDLDDVMARILDAALALDGVDAAVLSLFGDERGALVKSAGMSQEEAQRLGEQGASSVRQLEGELGPLGTLTVMSGSVGDLGVSAGPGIADLVRRAVPALDNAFRYREARRLADTDALTGLRNQRYFHEALARECKRAQRYGRSLALLVLDLDDFKAINARVGHLAGDAVLAEAAARMRSVLRGSDIACRVGGDEFAIALPEAGAPQASQLYDRVAHAVSASPIGGIERVTVSGGVAALESSEDSSTLFERADDALYRAKQSGKAQLQS